MGSMFNGLNVGNSSRGVRPPGGAHSDIFGINEDQPQAKTPNRRRFEPKSTLGPSFFMSEENKNVEANELPIPNEDDINKNLGTEGTNENEAPLKENDNEKKEESETDNQKISAQKRNRVPPGGYSSAFW